ncbi:MAG: T9SS type A sorting domain-containing protein [Bacteroidales bacterium]|nr:T9SS type A sorting domain-containing protein [Bacteroidales bacterium]
MEQKLTFGMNSKFFPLLLLLTISFSMISQEIISSCHVFPPHSFCSSTKSNPIKLPFYEDFSSTYGNVDSSKFSASTSFVNRTFAINPPTVGTLLFDALNERGEIYAHGNTYHFLADSLLSRPIRLDSIFIGIPHKTTPADSIYFSFFYQPQGIGEAPDQNDSLILEFFNPTLNTWNRVWASAGRSFQQFIQEYPTGWAYVIIPIIDTTYYRHNFQFKFKNYASYANNQFPTWSSNGDYWLIDAIYLNSQRTIHDSLPADLAFKTDMITILKDYTSMPWNQFLNSPSAIKTSISLPYKNHSSQILNVSELIKAKELSGNGTNFISPLLANNLFPYKDTAFYRQPIPFTLSSTKTKNVDFKIQFCINTNTIADSFQSNDTITIYQRFYNFFAIDDGSAEAGYGLSVANGEFTLQFTLYKPDTLRAILLFFNPVFFEPSEIPFFDLVIRKDENGFPGNIIYQKTYLEPIYDGYQYINYVLDEPVVIQGKIYIGIRQHLDESINIGFDLNTPNNNRLFFNVNGTWYNSLYNGVPMIRAVVGQSSEPYVSSNVLESQPLLFPHPCPRGNYLFLNLQEPTKIFLYNLDGKLLYESTSCENKVFIPTEMTPGFYLMKIKTSSAEYYQQIIIQ